MEEELRETLHRLREELVTTGPMDEDLRRELEQTLAQLQTRLAAGSGGASSGALVEGLESLTVRFEQSYPALAEGLGNVIRLLANLGI